VDSFWRKNYSWMSESQWECFEMLCELFGGANHTFGKVVASGDDGILINTDNCRNHFSTFDYDYLTRAVIMAHDRSIRFAIEPSSAGRLKLFLTKLHSRTGDLSTRHPTLEDAIIKIRAEQPA
jgi:hypothetical protein